MKNFYSITLFCFLYIGGSFSSFGQIEENMSKDYIYKKGDYQEYHSHSYNSISAIYILKSPEKNSSKIFFKSPDMGRGQLLNDRKAMLNNEFQWVNDVNVYQPNEGTLIIFPSHILHSVSPHNSDDERITLAYNFQNIK